MKGRRIKLDLSDFVLDSGARRWIFLCESKYATISDVVDELKSQYSELAKSDMVQLFMDETFLLPHWESIEILQSGDLVKVVSVKSKQSVVKTSDDSERCQTQRKHNGLRSDDKFPRKNRHSSKYNSASPENDINTHSKNLGASRRNHSDSISSDTDDSDIVNKKVAKVNNSSDTRQSITESLKSGNNKEVEIESKEGEKKVKHMKIDGSRPTSQGQMVNTEASIVRNKQSNAEYKHSTVNNTHGISPDEDDVGALASDYQRSSADDKLGKNSTVEMRLSKRKRKRKNKNKNKIKDDPPPPSLNNDLFFYEAANLLSSKRNTHVRFDSNIEEYTEREAKLDKTEYTEEEVKELYKKSISYNTLNLKSTETDKRTMSFKNTLEFSDSEPLASSSLKIDQCKDSTETVVSCEDVLLHQLKRQSIENNNVSKKPMLHPIFTPRVLQIKEMSKETSKKRNLTFSSGVEKTDTAKASILLSNDGVNDSNTVESPTDYTAYHLVSSSGPRVGDIIAFKMVEMSENYCPEISEYKEGKVLECDNLDKVVFEILNGNRKIRSGKFEIEDKDDEGNTVELRWSEVIEPRLVFP